HGEFPRGGRMNSKFKDGVNLGDVDEAKSESLVRNALGQREQDALRLQVQRQAMAMIPSLAKEEAKEKLQAHLDISRGENAQRVGSETLKTATAALVRNNAYGEELIRQHPA